MYGANFKTPRLRDRKYLDSFEGRPCEACGIEDGTIVGAHLRAGLEGGTSLKPPDDLVAALCYRCHLLDDTETWLRVLKNLLRERYQSWISQPVTRSYRRER